MPSKEQSATQADEKLLTVEERDACQKIAASGDGLAGQRATALLAIDEGATRAQASEQTGLTVGQIGYLLRVFQQKRMAMFPDAEPEEEEQPEEPVEPEAKVDEPKEDKEEKKAKAKKPKKGKKGKKAKAKKKVKKPKKDKKAKKKTKKGKAAKKKSKKN